MVAPLIMNLPSLYDFELSKRPFCLFLFGSTFYNELRAETVVFYSYALLSRNKAKIGSLLKLKENQATKQPRFFFSVNLKG